ncbi:spore germination protein [Sutcliffiella halmapala]|uniref:spore germination protein n=1 Tax=Sutcliffiella halmapala TaxID=79882 RepID=UPI001116F590|nr:spore germination protein [Sutcliffiella halmapala]
MAQVHEIDLSLDALQELFNQSSDVRIKSEEEIMGKPIIIIYCKSLVDSSLLHTLRMPFLKDKKNLSTAFQEEKKSLEEVTEDFIVQEVFDGKLVLITPEDDGFIYLYDISKIPSRNTEESSTDISIRGPKDGFIEERITNIGLIRKRLKTKSLVMRDYIVGDRSKTIVTLVYIEDIINQEILSNIKEKMEQIDIDVLTSSSMLEELIVDTPASIFPLVNYSGRPDFVVDSLNQGRFALIVDGAPTVLIAPSNFSYLFKTPEDANVNFYYATIERLLRFLGFAVTLFLPGFYTALITHNVGQLPLPLIATITVSRLGLPFPVFLETLIMLIMFELFKEAGVRLPKSVGQTVAVLGGLIIGDAAIRGGITSPTMLVIIGITAVASFTLVNQSLLGNVFIIRLYILALSAFFGIFGFMIGLLSIVLLLCRLQSFGISYMVNFLEFNMKDILYILFRNPANLANKRSTSLKPKDKTRIGGTSS